MKKIMRIVGMVLAAAVVAAVVAFWWRGRDERLFSALEADQRPSGALSRLQDIVDDHPDDLNAQRWLLRLEIEGGDLSAAQNRLNLLQVKAPDDYGTLSNACLFYLRKRQAQRAVKNCERAVELSGRSVEDLNRLASAYLLIPDFFKALPTLQEAKRKAPNDLKVLNNMGYYFVLVDIPEEAIRILQEVVEKDPNFLEARKNLAHAYYAGKMYPQASAEIEKILVVEPRNKDLLMIMALVQYMHFHNKDLGAEYARRAMAAGMDTERAQKLYQMISGLKPGTAMLPEPKVPQIPGMRVLTLEELKKMMASQPQGGTTSSPPPGAAPSLPAPPLPSPLVAPATPAPAPAPGATTKPQP